MSLPELIVPIRAVDVRVPEPSLMDAVRRDVVRMVMPLVAFIPAATLLMIALAVTHV